MSLVQELQSRAAALERQQRFLSYPVEHLRLMEMDKLAAMKELETACVENTQVWGEYGADVNFIRATIMSKRSKGQTP